MGLGSRIINRLIGPNLLIVAFVCVLMSALPLPGWLQSVNEQVDRLLLSAAIDFVDLPSPQTPITVIHVPDVEYEAWLSDIAGADALLKLIENSAATSSDVNTNDVLAAVENTATAEDLESLDAPINPIAVRPLVLGLIAEEPLSFIQGRAEKLLGVWAEKDKVNPAEFRSAIRAVTTDRDVLMATLRERAVVGMAGRISRHGENVSVESGAIAEGQLLQQLSEYVWPLQASPSMPTNVEAKFFSAPIEHLLLPAASDISQPLVVELNGEMRESFVLRLLRTGDQLAAAAAGLKPLPLWRQGYAIETGTPLGRKLAVSYDGSVIPLYGDVGINAPTVQLTLAAAQRSPALTGWVLLGRNDSEALRATAQVLAAIGDGAYITKPYFFPLLKFALLAALLLWSLVVLPRVSTTLFLVSGIAIVAVVIVAQVLLPSLLAYWLPLGGIITATVVIYILSAIARVKKRVGLYRVKEARHWALQAAQLNYHAGRYDQALLAIQRVPLSAQTIKWYYRIADALLENNAAKKAFPVWQLLYKKARNFRDVKKKINACEAAILPIEKLPEAPDKTQVVCVTASIETLGRYQVRSVLGHGGSGVVYQGFDPVISRDVALKTLNLNVFSAENQSKVKNRFLAEVKTIGKLSHPNIVAVYDVGQQDHWAYIAMDLARGKPLTEYLAQDQLLPIAEVYWIGLKVAEALSFAHQQNVVHCDIKPGNIIYDRDSGDVKVTDFGIAKWLDEAHTETGEIMGSPLYMAPEQLQGRPVAEQTDLFSLGATLYQLLTGEPPFSGRSIAEIQQAVLHSRPVAVRSMRTQLPASAARIVNRALKKKTSERFSSASDMAFTLNKAIIRDFKDEAKDWRLL